MTRQLALSALLLALPTVAPAQNDPRLNTAVRLAQEGMGDSARAVAGRVLSATRPTDPLYPEVLYVVATVSATTTDRRLYLQRVAVEYSRSEWADDALLQLAQLEYAGRNPAGTVQQITRLIEDYPLSPLRATAALWGARAAFDTRETALACQWVGVGMEAVGDEIETRNQLEFQGERCRALAVADSVARTTPPAKPAAAPATRPAGPQWLVQVAALKTREAADNAVATLKQMKYGAFTFKDGAFWKVRAGPFPSEAAASAAVEPIRKRLAGKPFVTRAAVP
jgi:hypothetical protein